MMSGNTTLRGRKRPEPGHDLRLHPPHASTLRIVIVGWGLEPTRHEKDTWDAGVRIRRACTRGSDPRSSLRGKGIRPGELLARSRGPRIPVTSLLGQQLVQLRKGNEDLPRTRTVCRTHHARVVELIYDPRRAPVADLQTSLE